MLVIDGRAYAWLWWDMLPSIAIALWLHESNVPIGSLVGVIAVLILADAGMATLNDVCDLDTDRASAEPDRNQRPLAAGVVPVSWGLAQIVILETLALVVAFFVAPLLALMIAAGIGWGIGYSVRPIRIGGRPFVNHLWWSMFVPATYLAVYLAVGGDFTRGWLYVLGSTLYIAFGEALAKDLRDYDNDRETGKRTTPVAIGAQRAAWAALVAFAAASAAWLAAALLVEPVNYGLVVALFVVLALWLPRVVQFARSMAGGYSKEAATELHSSTLRTFVVVNALFVAGLAA
jgi:4-hydroxybenzoate polyprenyltransferase